MHFAADELLRGALLAYKATLQAIEGPLAAATDQEWGVAGLGENYLTWLFGSVLARHEDLITKTEPSYQGGGRGDLSVARVGSDDPMIWVEARWWWRGSSLTPIFDDLAPKLRNAPGQSIRYALVYTVFPENAAWGNGIWNEEGAAACLRSQATNRWSFLDAVALRSTYSLDSSPGARPVAGAFAAAMYRLGP